MFSKASILSPSKPPHGSRCRPELSHQLHPSSQESPRPASAALQLSSKQLSNKLQPFLHGPHQPLQPHHLLQGKWRWNQKVNNACLNIKWQVSNLLDPSSLVSRHQQLLQCTWLFRQHPWYTPLPCYQPMSKPRQYYFNAAPTTRLSSWSPASEHLSSHLLDSWRALWWTSSATDSANRLRRPLFILTSMAHSPKLLHSQKPFSHHSMFHSDRGLYSSVSEEKPTV